MLPRQVQTTNNSVTSSHDSENEINKIPFSKKSMPLTGQNLSSTKSKEKLANLEVIRKCMQYLNTVKREGTIRNYEIDMAVEEYLDT